MTPEEARRISEAIKRWPIEDQIWWRALLNHAPKEAMIVAQLAVLLGARPHPPL